MALSVEFWSSVELGAFGRGLMRALGGLGIAAQHRFEVTEAEYRGAKSEAARAAVRWRSYVSYPVRLARRLRRADVPDIVVVCTNTFYAPTLAVWAARGVPVVNWVFDLFPDVLVESEKLRDGGVLEGRLAALARATFRRAAANVFLGEHLRQFAEQRYGASARSLVIPIGADGAAIDAPPPSARDLGAPTRLLYCGNLGHMHDIETVLPLVREPGPPGWTLEFRGHGTGFRRLSALAAREGANPRVAFEGSLPDDEWARVMRAADVALVTMKPRAESLVMPSKTYSAMMAGQAVLAVCAPASDLAETVAAADAGWVVPPGDTGALRTIVERLATRPDEVLDKRRNAYQAARRHYDQPVLAARWAELLGGLRGT